ncbi:MAG: FAD-dependent oxidoreductase [Alphaproteobacteria bacterium]|nr:FAD-dependent oxidoreductase [Alphaproteobacteria bacterium]
MSNQRTAQVVIIGGGVTGLSIAYHLARLGIDDVLLVERNQLASGTSWHAAGIIGPLRASMNLTRLAAYACELLPRLKEETGQDTGFRETGGYWLAAIDERMEELCRIAATGEMMGLDVRVLTPLECAEEAPFLETRDLAGALWVARDAQANPVDLCMAYAKGARAGGVRIAENVACTGIDTAHGSIRAIRLSSGETIRCKSVVNCAGVWAREIGRMAGVPVPLQAVEHMYVVTEPMSGLSDPLPVFRDLDNGIYIKGDTGKVVLGGFEPCPKVWDATGPDGDRAFLELPEDWDQFEPFMEAGLHRMPCLADAGIQHFMNGPESFTPDTRQLMGESPYLRGFYVAAGMNSIGMMSSAGVGRAMAEWIDAGEPPMDLWEVDIARFDRSAASTPFLVQRMDEAVANQLAMHWPLRQMATARGLRRSVLHDHHERAGAFLGETAGWERPLWFAATQDESSFRYSYGPQCWWPAASREGAAIRDRVALLDLSPFTKIDLAGRDCLVLMQQLCANDVDVVEGKVVYTPLLNRHGGIEADVTVTRESETDFRMVSGAATRQKDLAWIERQRARLELDVSISDATTTECVLGLVGPLSRDLMSLVTDADLSSEAFPFATMQHIALGMAPVRATRISFAGELGWELGVPVEYTGHVYETLVETGVSHGLSQAGMLVLDSCRIEKGFRHWGHELGPASTPLEAGLSFAVAWDKPGGFLGREALQRRRETGVERHLLMFAVEDAEPLLLHDEPIYRDGVLVGHTTSGCRGFRTGLSLSMGYVACPQGTPVQTLQDGSYEIGLGQRRLPMRPLKRAAYDPRGARMRG